MTATTAPATTTTRTSTAAGGRAWSIAFWVFVAAAIALRITLLFTPALQIDSDSSVVYLLTKHLSQGEIAWFFWGQPYGGTLLSFIAGAAMLVFGAHFEVLSIVATLIFAVAAVLLRALGTRLFDRRAGTVAGIVFLFSGYWMLRLSISEPGFYGPSIALALATILVTLKRDVRRPLLHWAVVGLLAGLAFWQSPMAAALVLPAVVILLVRQIRSRGIVLRLLVGVIAAVVGALPWIINFSASLGALTPKGTAGEVEPRSFALLFTSTLTTAFQATAVWPGRVVAVVAVLLILLLAVLAVRQRNAGAAALFAGTVLVIVVIVMGAGVTMSASDTRYVLYLLPALATSLGYLVTRVRFTGALTVGLAVVLTLVQITIIVPNLRLTTDGRYIVGDIAGLGDYLTAQHIDAVYADYWVAYSVAAETNEAVTGASLSEPRRYEPYALDAAERDPQVVVVLANHENDLAMRSGTLAVPAHERVEVDGYAIYTFPGPFNAYDYDWSLY